MDILEEDAMEEERVMEDGEVAGGEVHRALNSEERRDRLICYKLALLIPV